MQEQLAELLRLHPEVRYLWLDIPVQASIEQRAAIYLGIKSNDRLAWCFTTAAWPVDPAPLCAANTYGAVERC